MGRETIRRLLVVVLSVAMVLSGMPSSAIAEGMEGLVEQEVLAEEDQADDEVYKEGDEPGLVPVGDEADLPDEENVTGEETSAEETAGMATETDAIHSDGGAEEDENQDGVEPAGTDASDGDASSEQQPDIAQEVELTSSSIADGGEALELAPLEEGEPLLAVASIDAGPIRQIYLSAQDCGALLADGSLWTWGGNAYGAIGNGTTEGSYVPVRVLDDVSSFALCDLGGAAVKTDGSLWTWGGTMPTGDGRTGDDLLAPGKIMDGVASVAVGDWHAAAIKTDGSLWMWGYNYGGCLGLGDGSDSYYGTPQFVMGGVDKVVLGHHQSAAIDHDGNLFVWGEWYRSHDAGRPYYTSLSTPTPMLSGVVEVSIGDSSAALTSDGAVWTWGRNSEGEIGNGTVDETGEALVPYRAIDGVVSMSHSRYSNAVVRVDGSLWAWGDNTDGRLGVGDGTAHGVNYDAPPVTVATKVMDDVASTAYAGSNHQSAAVMLDGTLRCWGRGSMGDGTTRWYTRPGDFVTPMDGVVAAYVYDLGCLAIKEDGSVWIWGSNVNGTCATGDTENVHQAACIFRGGEWVYAPQQPPTPGGAQTDADRKIIERVRQYTSSDAPIAALERINAIPASAEQKFRMLCDFYHTLGFADVHEGVSYLSEATGHRVAYEFLVGNEGYCAYNWLDWLYNTPRGQAARAALYADGLIFNNERSSYLNPLDYINSDLPGMRKYKHVLREYLELEKDESLAKETVNGAKETARYFGRILKLNNLVQDEEMELLMDRIMACTSESELESLQRQFSKQVCAGVVTSGSGAILFDGERLAKALGYASSVISFADATVDDVMAMVNLDRDLAVYESHRRFLERVQGDPEVSWELRVAAASLLDEIEEGYFNHIVSIIGNAMRLEADLIYTDKSLMQAALEQAGLSEAAAGDLFGALGTLSFGTFVSNIVVDTSDVVNQAGYTQAYAELGMSFAWRLEQDRQAFLADESAENAWTFFEDYTTLWKLRYMGEQQYLDMQEVKAFIFGEVTLPGYAWKAELVGQNLTHLLDCRFDLSGGIEVPDGVQYEQKAVLRCPVDVEVYAPDGMLVATLEDGRASDVENEHGRFVVVYDYYAGEWAKVVCLSQAGDYQVVSRAHDPGLMSVEFAKAGEDATYSLENQAVEAGTEVSLATGQEGDAPALSVDQDGDGQAESEAEVVVTGLDDEPVAVEALVLSRTELVLEPDETVALSVSVEPAGATCQAVAWTSSDESVATVVGGRVVAVGPGHASIDCVSVSNPEVMASCAVDVATADSEPIDISGATVATIPAKTYTGSAIEPVPEVTYQGETLVNGTDYTLSYKNNTKAGTATLTLTGIGNFTGSKAVNYTISKASLSKATVTVKAQAYTGKALKPAPVVKVGTRTLKSGTDYTLAYKNNTKVGTATVTVKGKGNYSGSKSATFKITRPSVAKATVSKVANQKYDGKAKKPSPTVKVGGRTLKKGTDYTLAYKNNLKAGTATVTIKGKGSYTGTKSVTFRIVAMAGTWKESGSRWWYEWKDGKYPKSVFLDISGKTYYFDASGYCVYGWQKIGGKDYYFESSGAMAKSKWVGNYWLKADGTMATSEWVDGGKYWVGSDGAWVKGKTR